MSSNEFDMKDVIKKLKEKRKIFGSEAEFQLELAWLIKEEYPNAKVRLEYCPASNKKMHIDILVILNNKWYPIELKYKTVKCEITFGDDEFYLKDQGAKNYTCYNYLKDIQRIEKLREEPNFGTGYTMFITNDMSYLEEPKKENCIYKAFSLHNEKKEINIKTGEIDWHDDAKEGTKKKYGKINLIGEYLIKWKKYSKLDDSGGGKFKYLLNEIKKN